MTAALLLHVEISRRLNGQCRLDVVNRKAMTLEANRPEWHAACSTCIAPCESWQKHASGISGASALNMTETMTPDGALSLRWECPSCGHDVEEETTLLRRAAAVREIDADPLCGRCRKQTDQENSGS